LLSVGVACLARPVQTHLINARVVRPVIHSASQ